MEAVITSPIAAPEITTMPVSDVQDSIHTQTSTSRDSGPVPMSFPAILRTAGLTDRYAHLHVPPAVVIAAPPVKSRKAKRDENEGKRWVRRRENG